MNLTLSPSALATPAPSGPAPINWPASRPSERTLRTRSAPADEPLVDDQSVDVPTRSAGDVDDEPALSTYARCSDGNGTLSFLFFSDDDLDLARAKAICRSCGLAETCLSGAIEREEPYGVWGGKLILDGVPVEFKRKRGRPPKNPKPILVVDEAPIPPHLVA